MIFIFDCKCQFFQRPRYMIPLFTCYISSRPSIYWFAIGVAELCCWFLDYCFMICIVFGFDQFVCNYRPMVTFDE